MIWSGVLIFGVICACVLMGERRGCLINPVTIATEPLLRTVEGRKINDHYCFLHPRGEIDVAKFHLDLVPDHRGVCCLRFGKITTGSVTHSLWHGHDEGKPALGNH